MEGLKMAVKFLSRRGKAAEGNLRGLCSMSGTSSKKSNPIHVDDHDEVLVEGGAHSRTAILNRPASLNALSSTMGARLIRLYKSWEDDPDIGFVAMKGSGRAFCAGGDIVALHHFINQGKLDRCKEFFSAVYSFIYLLGTYLKPNVALLNGITMGGGAGVSIPGMFRVATEKTLFATPETLIGFHPDAGASFYLSHLPGHLGEYLALTGETLKGAEMLGCGLATHYTHSTVNCHELSFPSSCYILHFHLNNSNLSCSTLVIQKLGLVEQKLANLATDDPSVIETSLEEYCDLVYPDNMSVLHRIETVDKCFSQKTVEEIIDALETEAAATNDPWCNSTLRRLRECSPLSLKVSLKSIRDGRFQTLDQCLVREYRMTLQGISQPDFREGVRARMVDKDLVAKWNPPRLDQVTDDMVDRYFTRLSESEPDLELPTQQREAFTS
ncbi:3-hydroxyisobutyryl-CoA hydrolase-like protein 1, mitochondrial [Linum grandiflorum]